MLLEGAEKREVGKDVVIGIVETHGRKETETLVAPLPVIPRQEIVDGCIAARGWEQVWVKSSS